MSENIRRFAFNVHPDGRVDSMTMVPGNIHDSIPTGIYRIRFDHEAKNLYLDLSEFPNPPSKVYGSVHKDTARYLKTFETQDICMGVGLYGLKGTGKTTTLQVIAKTALGLDYPVLIVDHAIPLEMLANLFAKIKQNIVVMFDEFDKHYYNPELNEERSAQNGILNILDGSCGGGKKLTIICANDYDRINDYLKGRPGRIRYSKFFESLKFPEVMEYLKDNYKQGTNTKETIQLAIVTMQINMTYDLLKAYITESNIHNESIVNSIQAISSEVFRELKAKGTFGGEYSCIQCFDESNQDYVVRINRDYSSYSIFKKTIKTNEFEFTYTELIQIQKGDFSELKINVCDFGFEIETNLFKFKTKNYHIHTDNRSDEKVIEHNQESEKLNPKEIKCRPGVDDVQTFNVIKHQQPGIGGRMLFQDGVYVPNRHAPKTNEPLNWDWSGPTLNNLCNQDEVQNSQHNEVGFQNVYYRTIRGPHDPDEPTASNNG